MLDVPTATPATIPVPETVATVGTVDSHETGLVTTFPAASFATAVACVVWPTITLDEVVVTVTDMTATAATVIVVDPAFPSTVAVIVAVPGETAATRPVEETVAFEVDDQATVLPVKMFPFASFEVEVACVVEPTVTVPWPVVTVTVATGRTAGGTTLSAACPVFPSDVAKMFAEPVATPVAIPDELTVAIDVAEELYVMALPVSTFPAASRNVVVLVDV